MTAEPEKPAHAAQVASSNPVSKSTMAVVYAFVRILPRPIRRRLESQAGDRFLRFAPVALATVITSQVVLAILTAGGMSAGKAALIASIVGAFVSYVLSRWVWESKGRPDLLRETVPFWLVSFAVWGILSLVTHYAGSWAKTENLHHLEKHLVINGAYLAANCITFVCRFLIFHYVLFANKRQPVHALDATEELAAAAPAEARAASPAQEQDGMALAGETTTTRQVKPPA
jgi:putative flippase GtrA